MSSPNLTRCTVLKHIQMDSRVYNPGDVIECDRDTYLKLLAAGQVRATAAGDYPKDHRAIPGMISR